MLELLTDKLRHVRVSVEGLLKSPVHSLRPMHETAREIWKILF